MKEDDFDKLIKEHFGPIAEEMGFSCEGGKGCTFHRKINDELFHFISFDLKSNKTKFEVYIFPATPRLGEESWQGFPDFVGIPTGRAAGLNAKYGIGSGPSVFPCKDKTNLEMVLGNVVIPAINSHTESYLSQFKQLEDIIPVLEHPEWAALLKLA